MTYIYDMLNRLERVKDDKMHLDPMLGLWKSCENATLAKRLSVLLPNTDVMGPTTKVVIDGPANVFTKRGYYLEDNGTWNTYRNGSLVSSKAGGWSAESNW